MDGFCIRDDFIESFMDELAARGDPFTVFVGG
jgi:hypothetical protein